MRARQYLWNCGEHDAGSIGECVCYRIHCVRLGSLHHGDACQAVCWQEEKEVKEDWKMETHFYDQIH